MIADFGSLPELAEKSGSSRVENKTLAATVNHRHLSLVPQKSHLAEALFVFMQASQCLYY